MQEQGTALAFLPKRRTSAGLPASSDGPTATSSSATYAATASGESTATASFTTSWATACRAPLATGGLPLMLASTHLTTSSRTRMGTSSSSSLALVGRTKDRTQCAVSTMRPALSPRSSAQGELGAAARAYLPWSPSSTPRAAWPWTMKETSSSATSGIAKSPASTRTLA